MEPRREHSRKPDIYDRIERLVRGPYVELFTRQSLPAGWHGWNPYERHLFSEPAA
jgi:N6-adenosine-specific RNA methylase IME4